MLSPSDWEQVCAMDSTDAQNRLCAYCVPFDLENPTTLQKIWGISRNRCNLFLYNSLHLEKISTPDPMENMIEQPDYLYKGSNTFPLSKQSNPPKEQKDTSEMDNTP